MTHSKEEKLARELSDTLGDQESLPFYRDLVLKYSETFLKAKLKKVMSIPPDQIRKTRGALFTYLIMQHERRYANKRLPFNDDVDHEDGKDNPWD